ncbi:MAG: 50S ribosomal protein L9 [Desulfobacterales bacterium CG23_combo_of_CG06-09_8_20_14_all_51_8]|nr:MAG: 50S ribosomal protein L9 [Desulfobacterales bacterium CG23_combo_of_CG06-09_8_20_14_all_51_8]
MKVILRETIEPLGIIGSEVEVKKGFARNYLIPRGKAVFATPQNRNILAQEKAKVDLQIAKEQATAEEMAKKLEGIVCKITAKVAEEGRLYGSVTTREIFDALTAQNIQLEKRMILLKEPIKEIGSFKVPIRIYKGIKPEITVTVEAA